MKGKKVFSSKEADVIISLIRQKLSADRSRQKTIRAKIRRLGFYASDFGLRGGYNVNDFKQSITVIDSGESPDDVYISQIQKSTRPVGERITSDESYIIDLCDVVLGLKASRQHRFDFLRGDAGTMLPVDAYYVKLNLVIEYREKQHSEEVKFFDRKKTVSGVNRGEQRRIYDQRRREVLPAHGIRLVELNYSDFAHSASKRLSRDRGKDLDVIRYKLGGDR